MQWPREKQLGLSGDCERLIALVTTFSLICLTHLASAAPRGPLEPLEQSKARLKKVEATKSAVLENAGDATIQIQWRAADATDWSRLVNLDAGERKAFQHPVSVIVRVAGREPRSGYVLSAGASYRFLRGKIVRVVQPRVLEGAAEGTTTLHYTPPEIRALLAILADKQASRSARDQAARKLAGHGAVATPGLIDLLRDPSRDPIAGGLAAAALARIGAVAAPLLSSLITSDHVGVADENLARENRRLASDALVAIGRPAAPVLTKILQNIGSRPFDRALAADVLGKIEPSDKATKRALTDAAQDKHEMVRRHARAALKRIAMRTSDSAAGRNEAEAMR